VRIIKRKTLSDFWQMKPDSEQALKTWFFECKKAHWNSPGDLKLTYPTASILKNNRVVFNIRGNVYRLIAKINYSYGIVYIRFIGTHAEYDRINAEEI